MDVSESHNEEAHTVGPIFALKESTTKPKSNPKPQIIVLPVAGEQ
jgi:hypothetical protein